ncbi:MAG: hypothetical protein V4510_09630 [bacterium]
MADKPRGAGKPFTKNDPRRAKGGRPKKSVSWKQAEDKLREAIPRLLVMDKNDLHALLASNPTGAEMLAAKYLHEHAVEAVNRFLGKTATVLTGAEGKPLIPTPPPPALPPIDFSGPLWTPERLDEFIKATAQALKKPA